jgi:hypothetical protein
LHNFYGLIAIIFIDIIETSKLNALLSNIIIIFDNLAKYAINNKRTITITIYSILVFFVKFNYFIS